MADEAFELDSTLTINAWTGSDAPRATPSPQRIAAWALARQTEGPGPEAKAMAPTEVLPWDWRHPQVGWGLVLPDNVAIAPEARAGAEDAPPALQRLLAARPGAPVLRWNAEEGHARLLRYDGAGKVLAMSMVGSEPGMGPKQLPRYLLIAASPQTIPWAFQYAANLSHYVGRIDLDGTALENYIDALLTNWAGASCDPRAPLVWSVDHGPQDITWLMDQAISRKVLDAYANDRQDDLKRRIGLLGEQATGTLLIDALIQHRPALVVSTSHGMTGPLSDSALTAAQLGAPVDRAHQVIDIEDLVARWSPDGAIWYSHACCAAGSDTSSDYAGLFDAGSDVMRVLDGVAQACGACVAPLPRRLLGAKRPLRAFIGHVEPTFNWTLRDRRSGQPLTSTLRQALYDGLYADGGGRPVAWALSRVFDDAGAMLGQWAQAVRDFNKARPGSLESALYYQVTALDRQHTVILGDPTVAVPQLALCP